MKLVLLGTGGYYPTSRRQTACLFLPEIGVVLDAGSGMCRLGEYRQSDQLEIFLTHAHLDHVAGLTYLISVVTQEVARKTTVYGEGSKLAAIQEHLFDEAIFPIMPPFRCQPLDNTHELPGNGTLTHFPLAHPGGSVGYRLDWPRRSMAYVTDTTAAPGVQHLENIRGVDLLVHEAYFASDEGDLPSITGHSSLPAVVELAAAARVQRLVLVHIDPTIEDDAAFDLSAARRVFPKTEIGVDEMQIEF
jgi:ribonuclease BN (tRNA processing enzyme)